MYDSPATYQLVRRQGSSRQRTAPLSPGSTQGGDSGWVGSGLWKGPNGRYYDRPETFALEQRNQSAAPFDSVASQGKQNQGHWIASGIWQGPDNLYYDSPQTFSAMQRNGGSQPARNPSAIAQPGAGTRASDNPTLPTPPSTPHQSGTPEPTGRPQVATRDSRIQRFPIPKDIPLPDSLKRLVREDRPDLQAHDENGHVVSRGDSSNGGIQKRFEIHVRLESTENLKPGDKITGGASGAALVMRVPLTEGGKPVTNAANEALCEHGIVFTAHSLPYDQEGRPNPAEISIRNSTITDAKGNPKVLTASAQKSLRVDVKPGHETHSRWGLQNDPLKDRDLKTMTDAELQEYFNSKIQRGNSDAAIAYFEAPCDFYPAEAITELVPKGWQKQGGKAVAIGTGGREVSGTLTGLSEPGGLLQMTYDKGQTGIEGGASGGPVLNENGLWIGPIVSAQGQREDGKFIATDHRAPDFVAESMVLHLRSKGIEVPADFRGGDFSASPALLAGK